VWIPLAEVDVLRLYVVTVNLLCTHFFSLLTAKIQNICCLAVGSPTNQTGSLFTVSSFQALFLERNYAYLCDKETKYLTVRGRALREPGSHRQYREGDRRGGDVIFSEKRDNLKQNMSAREFLNNFILFCQISRYKYGIT